MRSELPRWPVTLMFAAFPLWWVLGVAELAWIPIAAIMAGLLARRGDVRVPRGFGVWLMFLAIVALSVIGIDSSGRLLGFALRGLQYLALTVAFVYVYNARRTLTLDAMLGMLTVFWLFVVAGGWLGVLAPEFAFRTPFAYVLPASVQQNELVGEMVVRRATQWNPDAWTVLDPRPSAPFLYTNGWGNAYSLLLPLVLARMARMPRDPRFAALAVAVALSIVPAALTLNRGMFLGLAVAAVYGAGLALVRGRPRAFVGTVALGLGGVAAALVLDVGERLFGRISASSSTEDRANLYAETIERVALSPFLGYGAPRPSWTEGAPSVGTQGHVWTVLFSHGVPACALFLGALVWFAVAAARSRSVGASVVHVVAVVLLVEVFYYGVLPHGLALVMLPLATVLPHGASLPHPAPALPHPVREPARALIPGKDPS